MEYSASKAAKILIVDDHPIVRQGVALMINREPDLQVCHEAENAQQAIEVNKDCSHDLAIVDVSLVGVSGLELVKKLRQLFPDMKVLVMSMHDETIYAERALQAGALGYLMKQEATDTILRAIRKTLRGELYVSERMHDHILQQKVSGVKGKSSINSLTPGEFEIFRMIGSGQSTNEIADTLQRSVKTIATHRANIKKKLNFDSISEFTHFAITFVNDELGGES